MSYILIVDDEVALGDLLQDILSDEGYDVRSATTATEALTLVSDRQPSLILFDFNLPGLSGDEFVEAYRQLPGATARLVAISGIVGLAAEANRIGADDFIVKPFEIDEVLATVARALE